MIIVDMNDELAEALVTGLAQNLIRGWGLHQFCSENGQIALLNALMWMLAKSRDGDFSNNVKEVQQEMYDFYKRYYDPVQLSAGQPISTCHKE